MIHVVLLGDSIFDNAAYVLDGPDVAGQLRNILPETWEVTLLAVDGDVIDDVRRQLNEMPLDTTHIVVSCGGNDAFGYSSVLNDPVHSVSEALGRFATLRSDFGASYLSMLDHVVSVASDVIVCTVCDSVPGLGPEETAALSLFNELILREAFLARVGVIDLRLVCPDDADYSALSPIESSRIGGEKIANAIRRSLLGVTVPGDFSKVYV